MTDLLITSESSFDPAAMTRLSNLLLESAKFHAPDYAWQLGRFRAVGDITVEATSNAATNQQFRNQAVSVETKISITLMFEFKNASASVSVVAGITKAAKCDFYTVGSFHSGNATIGMPADTFSIETLTDAVEQSLAGLGEKVDCGFSALVNSTVYSGQ